MTIKQAIKILEYHTKWRRGGKGKMTDPTHLGIALETAINELKNIKNDIHAGRKGYNKLTIH